MHNMDVSHVAAWHCSHCNESVVPKLVSQDMTGEPEKGYSLIKTMAPKLAVA